MTELKIESERVNDLPLLIRQEQKMGIDEVIDVIIQPHWACVRFLFNARTIW